MRPKTAILVVASVLLASAALMSAIEIMPAPSGRPSHAGGVFDDPALVTMLVAVGALAVLFFVIKIILNSKAKAHARSQHSNQEHPFNLRRSDRSEPPAPGGPGGEGGGPKP